MNKVCTSNEYAADCAASLHPCYRSIFIVMGAASQIQSNSQRSIWDLMWGSGGLKPLFSHLSLRRCLGPLGWCILFFLSLVLSNALRAGTGCAAAVGLQVVSGWEPQTRGRDLVLTFQTAKGIGPCGSGQVTRHLDTVGAKGSAERPQTITGMEGAKPGDSFVGGPSPEAPARAVSVLLHHN